MVLLIYPPVAKPCEPPAGIACLAGALKAHGIRSRLVDGNLEAMLHLVGSRITGEDTWTKRALRGLDRNMDALRCDDTYSNQDRYSRAVHDLNRVLEKAVQDRKIHAGLGNYQDDRLSPVKSGDLIEAASHPETNPFYPWFSRRIAGIIEEEKPSLVGLSLTYLTQALATFAMAGFIRRNYPGLRIVLGGGLVTSWLRNLAWTNPFKGIIDDFVAGPGEIPLLALLGINASGGPDVLPDFTPLPLRRYFAPGLVLPYSASTGCYWNRCAFCPERAEGNKYVPSPPERVLKDLGALIGELEPSLIHFLDNAMHPTLLEALIDDPPGVPWYGFVRFTRYLTDPGFCAALKRSGCVMLKLGLESGDEGVLKAMGKGISLPRVSEALRALHGAGIATYVYLLFGTPAETLGEARNTLDFVARHSDMITFLNVAIFNLPLNSPHSRGLSLRTFYEGDLSLYADFVHPGAWGRREVRDFLEKEFKRHPAIAPIIRRDPPVFTSNHAPFFVMKK
jgi:hypothetical protein